MHPRAGSIVIGLLALGVCALRAQTLEANVARARRFAARDAGAVWGARLDTVPRFFVGDDSVYLTADPGVPGYIRRGDLWAGPLPGGVIPANTSLDWAGRRWAMVMLPLPDDTAAAARLLLHETWHVLQPAVLPIPLTAQTGAGTDLLDQPQGRLWLLLEWRALAEALETAGAAEDSALGRALLFRARRYAAATDLERARERLLDLSEGLAEYTGWRLTGSDARELAARLRTEAPRRRSYVRAFPYYTGPAYGLLLDRRLPGWIGRLRDTLDLQALIARTLPVEPATVADLSAAAERAGRAYGIDSLRASEAARWAVQQHRVDSLRALFVDGPTLRLRPKATQIAFDPGRQYSLGALGSVMGGFQWKDAGNAELTAPEGALVGGDWQEIRVPLDTVTLTEGVLTRPQTWTTGTWTLTLPAGWNLTRAGASWIATPPQ